jgi:signal transduction histidine kinase
MPGVSEVAEAPRSRVASRVAWTLLALCVIGFVLHRVAEARLRGDEEDAFFSILAGVGSLVYAGTGALIASRQPRNPIGWILLWIGTWVLITGLVESYISWSAVEGGGTYPLTRWVVWMNAWTVIPVLYPVPLLFLLFPDGTLLSRRWKPVAWAVVAGVATGALGFMVDPTPLTGGPDVAPITVPNPTAVSESLASVLITISGVLALATAFLSILAMVLRYRRSRNEERQQMRLMALVAGLGGVLLVAMFTSMAIGAEQLDDVLFMSLAGLVALGIPIACTIAVLRYRLYQIDVVVKKTVLYTVLVLLIGGAGAAVFVVAGGLLTSPDSPGRDSPLALLLAGVAIGVLVLPLRGFATRVANRVVYGKRATPYEVLTRFAGRVGETYSTEDVLPRMAAILGEATGAVTARVWVRLGGRLEPEASWPTGVPELEPIAAPRAGELPVFPAGEHPVEVRHQGELLGALSVTMPPSDPMNPAKEKLVRDLAEQAGLVLRNVRLIEELRASRQRLVAAQDSERRRIERNIHDGAQQQLVALAVKLRLAQGLTAKDPAKAAELLTQLQTDTQAALDDLRDLARGIYPPLLADRGLVAAVDAQARRAAFPVEVRSDADLPRYAQEVEAAVYFCVLEALQNVAKYAGAEHATVSLAASNGDLRFTVADDGAGFDATAGTYGTGLQGMSDRLEALGGRLEVRSQPGSGTEVEGSVPAAPRTDR